ncbi:perilipin-2-like [Ruditapes philippinarum]|uniref:perilipin-2-like n=1 Tax=Ruditapes philippinarum TaxID=129788 RepID=UPI00295B89D4|nr:perilipin-2-like [Ruditapes philippinarum]
MYRRAVNMEQEQIANEQFIYRLGSLPVVSSAWSQACDIYNKTKESNTLLRVTCNMAEGGVQSVVSTAKPYVEKYQPQIETVNSYACEKLALMEEQYPVITKPTDEFLKEGKDKCAGVLKPVTDRVNAVKDTYNGMVNKGHETYEATKGKVEAVKDYSMTTVSRTLESPLGKFAMEKVNEALTVSEEYVEKYLPPSEEEMTEAEKAPLEVDEVGTLTRVTSLSTKVSQRMFRRAIKDLKGLQMRSKEKLDSLNFTVDLIQYAKSGAGEVKDTLEEKYEIAQNKMAEYWEKINDDADSDGEDAPETFEGKTIVVARRLTRQVKQGMTTVSGYLPARLQPTVVRERMENAIKYTEELYMAFKEAQRFDDLPHWLLAQAKEKMSYIQETVSFLTETFLVSPISWMFDLGVSIDGIELDDPSDMINLQFQVPVTLKHLPAA